MLIKLNNKSNKLKLTKNQASGSTNSMSQEFGMETDVNQIRQQIQQAEANKKICFWPICK
ncbi:gamma-type small acid-soluble spore protein [Lysinibacillus sp. MHQ-1]|nr:gamma-type small acid-soluble spore protein [Lysinibacillus sp. MHQ-1]